uniref:hypothetical protein n=1 Tax=Saccharothrix espanaensis TaxID=103731 RepID=UPI003F49334E
MTFSDQAGKWHTPLGVVDQDVVDAHAAGRPTGLRKAVTAAHNTARAGGRRVRFRDLVERIAADRVIELVADAAEAVRAAGLATIAERRSAYEDAAAARRAAHDVDLAERWTRPASNTHSGSSATDTTTPGRRQPLGSRPGRTQPAHRRRWLSPDVPAAHRAGDRPGPADRRPGGRGVRGRSRARARRVHRDEAQQLAELDQEVAEAAAEAEAAAHAKGGAGRPVIAGYTGVSVGSVSVEYDGDDDGVRHLDADYDLDFEPSPAPQRPGLDAAEQQFDSAVLDGLRSRARLVAAAGCRTRRPCLAPGCTR